MSDRDLTAVLHLVEQLQPALERRERARLVEIVRQLIEARAPLGSQWQQVALLAATHGEIGLARAAIDLLSDALGGGAAGEYQKAALLALLGFWAEADSLMRALPGDVPDAVGNTYSRGMIALNLGRPDEARGHLERVVQLQPQAGSAWLALSMMVDFAHEPALAESVIAAERAMANAPQAHRIPYWYALGKVHADLGEHASAFEAFARGGREVSASVSYDRDADRTDAARAVEGYSAERVAAIAAAQREPSARTIFVAGLPRSGTTLVERILTSHSTVAGGGEIDRLALLAAEVGGQSYPELADYADAHGVASVPPLWHHWLDELFPASGRVVDKTVATSRYLGLAASLLPEAPLIWMERNPLDRAWSCFRTNFNGSAMPWSYDLEAIAYHFRLEDALLAGWRDILGDRLLVVPYESLVSEPEPWTRRILAHCAMDEEPEVFAPHRNPLPATTASLAQVRRPIHREAVGAAEPYRPFLQPFVDAYRR